ncbi:hypothetical protein LCGC14_2227530, partial [marine sediment metagenome]
MRYAPRVISALMVIGGFAGSTAVASVEPPEAITQHIKAIAEAATASDVIAAYAAGLALDRRDVTLHEAYLRRMVDLGRADVLGYQAQLLISLEPGNGLAWAVVAFGHADRGEFAEAFSAIRRAVKRLPEDEFVANLAGQMVGWYDREGNESALAEILRPDVARLRAELGKNKAFRAGYKVV